MNSNHALQANRLAPVAWIVRPLAHAMNSNLPLPKFAIGQKVRVRLSVRNRTAHEGTIRDIIWHFKDQRHNYYLEEGGKKVSKRYYDDDLERLES
jgi:hypothetical protein